MLDKGIFYLTYYKQLCLAIMEINATRSDIMEELRKLNFSDWVNKSTTLNTFFEILGSKNYVSLKAKKGDKRLSF